MGDKDKNQMHPTDPRRLTKDTAADADALKAVINYIKLLMEEEKQQEGGG